MALTSAISKARKDHKELQSPDKGSEDIVTILWNFKTLICASPDVETNSLQIVDRTGRR